MTGRVLHVVNWGKGFSGAQRRARYTLSHPQFAPAFRHALLSLKMPAREARDSLAGSIEACLDGRYLGGIELPASPRCLRRWRARRALQRAAPDVVLTWSWRSGQRLMAPSSRGLGAPGILMEPGDMLYARTFKHPAAYRRVLAGHGHVICNSRAAMRVLNLAWERAHGVEVIPNPVDPHLDYGRPRQLPADRALTLGVAGRMVDIKGVPLAMHALKALREGGIRARLEIAGGGPREADYRALAERLGVGHACRFQGPVADMAAFYDSIDILLVPSLCESFGLVSVEAAKRGCPVVAACTGGLPETIQEGKTGYTVPLRMPVDAYPDWGGDLEHIPPWVYLPEADALDTPRAAFPGDLADAVARIATDPEQYASLSRHSIAHAAEHFSMDRFLDRINRLLARVAGRGGPSGHP